MEGIRIHNKDEEEKPLKLRRKGNEEASGVLKIRPRDETQSERTLILRKKSCVFWIKI